MPLRPSQASSKVVVKLNVMSVAALASELVTIAAWQPRTTSFNVKQFP